MTLPLAQSRVPRFVADAGKGLVTLADLSSWPARYEVTDEGKEALAAGDGA